jgi:hypothetical protein
MNLDHLAKRPIGALRFISVPTEQDRNLDAGSSGLPDDQ